MSGRLGAILAIAVVAAWPLLARSEPKPQPAAPKFDPSEGLNPFDAPAEPVKSPFTSFPAGNRKPAGQLIQLPAKPADKPATAAVGLPSSRPAATSPFTAKPAPKFQPTAPKPLNKVADKPTLQFRPSKSKTTLQPAVHIGAGNRIDATGPKQGYNTTPRQATPYVKTFESRTPSLTVDWVTPETITVGQEGDFELVLRNRGVVAIERVSISHVLPEGFTLVRAEPRQQGVDANPMWSIDKLGPGEEARINLRLKPTKPGDVRSHARVTFSTSTDTKFKVVQPLLKLVAEIPDTAIVGNQVIMNVSVENPGTGITSNTLLNVKCSEGLVPVSKSTTYTIGDLNPGEKRSIRLLANVAKLGEHKVTFVTTADNGLRQEATMSCKGLGAQLVTSISGPSFRYVNRPATFQVTVKNTGTAAADNVHVRCAVPQTFGFIAAKDFGKFDAASKTVNWLLNRLEPSQEVKLECELKALDRGSFPVLAAAIGERGLKSLARHETKVEGIAAILLEVVDVDDPVEVGAETAYEVLVTNQGTDFAKNVSIEVHIPEGLTVTGVKGPTLGEVKNGKIAFKPLQKLAPRADAIYRVKVKGTKAGDFRVSVKAQSDTLDSPVTEQESTKVYQD